MKNNAAIKTNFCELKFLDSLLRENSKDMNVIKVHGFLTALASFPNLHTPNEWLPILVGNLKSTQPVAAQSASNGLTNLYQQIHLSLHSGEDFKFLLSIDYPDLQLRQVRYESIQEWCRGYCLALVWQDQQWLHQSQEYISNACATFFIIADLLGTKTVSHKKELIESLPDIVKSLYIYWLDDPNKPQLLTEKMLH